MSQTPFYDKDDIPEGYLGYYETRDRHAGVLYNPHEYDAGTFKPGDRIVMTEQAANMKHIGATGTVVKVERKADGGFTKDLIFPITVWLDVFGRATKPEMENGMGLPVCARELRPIPGRVGR